MFGLDARIALAVFGALSVISSASLYSAIQDSKLVSLLTEIKEVEKAFDTFYLDTDRLLPYSQGSAPFVTFYDTALFTNSGNIAGWEGPYLPTMEHKYGSQGAVSRFRLFAYKADAPGASLNSATAACVENNCNLWINVDFVDSLSFLEDFDEKYDDGSGFTGNIRYGSASAIRNYMYFKSSPVRNPN